MEFVNTDDTPISFECAVVIYPPAGRQHRNMFKLLMMSELESILTGVPPLTDGTSGRRRVNIGSETKKVTWPERGWRRREDWQDEMEQGLNDGESSVSGVVVARRLTKQEAETLVGQLLARAKQVNAAVVPMKSTRLYSSVAPAPSRERNTGLGGEEGKEANDLASPCQASSVRHHVVVYAPDAYLPDDYEWDTPASGEFIDQWYEREVANAFCGIMRGDSVHRRSGVRGYGAERGDRNDDNEDNGDDEDSEGGNGRVDNVDDVYLINDDESTTGTHSWADRGWVNGHIFLAHTKASLKKTGQCSFLRRATLSDAREVLKALEEGGFAASLFVTPGLEAEKGEEDRPVVLCPAGHPAVAVERGYYSSCSRCWGQGRLDDAMLRCALCEYELCSGCVSEKTKVLCPVLEGRHRGDNVLYPDTTAMSLCPSEDSAAARRRVQAGGVDAVTFLSSQVIGDNTNVGGGEGGAREDEDLAGRLQGVLGRLGVEENSKPKAKSSAVAALVRRVMGEEEGSHTHELKDESCIICMNEFRNGDVVMKMPCGHWFHEGAEEGEEEVKEGDNDDEEEGPCGGIIPWLKTSNKCPMCREEIEADTGAALEDLLASLPPSVSLSGPWSCPGCRLSQTTYTCSSPGCDVRRNVLIAAEHTALPFMEAVEVLFFDLLGHHELKRRGEPASLHELELQCLRIPLLMTHGEGEVLLQNNWRVREAVEHLLKSVARGDTHFTFSAPWMDANSKALYVLLVDKLKEKISALNVSTPLSFDLPCFSGGVNSEEEGGGGEWTCPLCTHCNGSGVRACVQCGCDGKVLVVARSDEEMQNVERVFDNAESLVFRAFAIMDGRGVSDGVSESKVDAMKVLEKDVEVFLGSMDVRRLEHAGWEMKSHLFATFASLCRQEKEITFQYYSYSDVSSAGLYAVLVRRLRSRLLENGRGEEESLVRVMEPQINRLVKADEDFESFTEQRFHVHGRTFGLLQSQRKLLVRVAHLIAEKASEHYWVRSLEALSHFGDRWPIAAPVDLMREGERNLDVLADDMECFPQAVVEAILRKVVAIESAMSSTAGEEVDGGATHPSVNDGSEMGGSSGVSGVNITELTLTPDTSIDIAVRCLLQQLKNVATEALYAQSLKLLLKTLRALTSAPNALSSRRLRKNSPSVVKCVLSPALETQLSSPLLEVLHRLGFTDEGSHFSLVKLVPELISKALVVAEDLAAEVNIA